MLQTDMIAACYDRLKELKSTAIAVDAYSKLEAHKDEYLYFRSDHHWTALGASLAYTAFCESAGPQGRAAEPSLKAANTPASSARSTAPSRPIPRVRPLRTTRTLCSSGAHSSIWTRSGTRMRSSLWNISAGTLCKVDDTSNKYLTFLGGDHPITVIKTNVDGPVCMILKESYGNAFTPWLTSHYSKIIAIDPREFNRDGKPSLDLAAFAKEQGVNDCIVLDYPIMLNSDSYITWLERLVD